MMKKVFVHGSGHKAASWNETISHMESNQDVLCPNLSSILRGKKASYTNLYTFFSEFCSGIDGRIHLCGISLGGILALNYAIDFPDKVDTLVLIGTPHKIPKLAFGIQTIVFKCLPESFFKNMEFSKKDIFILGNSMKALDLSGRVQNVNCPALIICGEKDHANLKSAYYLSEHMKDAALKIMEDTGHIVNEEAPKALANLLDEYYHEHQ